MRSAQQLGWETPVGNLTIRNLDDDAPDGLKAQAHANLIR